ncbi:hypothetical protein [Nocardioides stalactiti]|uniref:hypothetical protein n=1 Tax=Nocardioides stalactiti TaxID=2755356 RepID=UPI00160186D6|nr:hypothetical protein [Nocardioides stalactiti]
MVTVHAVVLGRAAQVGPFDGCPRERHDREAERVRRRIRRRIAGLAADGITVVRDVAPDEMHLDQAILELIEHDTQGLRVSVSERATDREILRGLEAVEDLVDRAAGLGHWRESAGARWRGLAWRP